MVEKTNRLTLPPALEAEILKAPYRKTAFELIREFEGEDKLQLVTKCVLKLGIKHYMNLYNFIYFIRKKYIEQHRDCMVLVTGAKGSGKSSLALRALSYYRLITEGTSRLSQRYIKKHMIFSKEPYEIKRRIRNAPRGSFLFFDEAARFLLGEDWNTRESRSLKKIFAEVRPKNIVYFFNCPFRLRYIDKKYVSDLFDFWILILDWDRAVIFRKNLNPALEGYDIKKFEKIGNIYAGLSENDWRKVKRKLARMPGFFATVRWGKIPPTIYEYYERIRNQAVFEEDTEIMPQPVQAKSRRKTAEEIAREEAILRELEEEAKKSGVKI